MANKSGKLARIDGELKETVTISKEHYEAIVKYFDETTIDVLKLYKKIGKKEGEALLDFTSKNCH